MDCDALPDDQGGRIKGFVPGGTKGKRAPRADNRFLDALLRMAWSGRAYLPIMPGIEDRLAASEYTPVLADHAPVLADDDAVGIGVEIGRPTALALTEYLLLSKRTRQVLESDAGTA